LTNLKISAPTIFPKPSTTETSTGMAGPGEFGYAHSPVYKMRRI
jgi:hypothetical protein